MEKYLGNQRDSSIREQKRHRDAHRLASHRQIVQDGLAHYSFIGPIKGAFGVWSGVAYLLEHDWGSKREQTLSFF